MSSLFKARINHGFQAIKSLENAEINKKYRGFPNILVESVADEIEYKLKSICPTNAIKNNLLSIDLGKCIFCGYCEDIFNGSYIQFTNKHKLFGFKREDLIVTAKTSYEFFENLNPPFKSLKIFKRSLKIRNVSTGGCNSCELELSASFNVNFDASRFGIEIAASPRHADAMLITGPMTKNMKQATVKTWEAMPEPKICILFGSCAISKGIFEDSQDIDREFLETIKPALYIPGCPVHPLNFIAAIKRLIGWGKDEP